MHAVLDDTDIEQIKRNRDTLRVYTRRLRGLQKSGQGYVCKCPFHPDNTPSFGTYLHDGVFLFKCLGCGVTGNVIQFLMQIQNHFVDG